MTDIFRPENRASIIPRRMLGAFTGYVTLSESASDKLTITSHPVQEGAKVSDHAFVEPASLDVSLVYAPEDAISLAERYEALRQLQASRVPFDVVTGKRSYKNMLIATLSNTTDADGENILQVSIELTEVRIARVTAEKLAPRERLAKGKAQDASAKKKGAGHVKQAQIPRTDTEQAQAIWAKTKTDFGRVRHGDPK